MANETTFGSDTWEVETLSILIDPEFVQTGALYDEDMSKKVDIRQIHVGVNQMLARLEGFHHRLTKASKERNVDHNAFMNALLVNVIAHGKRTLSEKDLQNMGINYQAEDMPHVNKFIKELLIQQRAIAHIFSKHNKIPAGDYTRPENLMPYVLSLPLRQEGLSIVETPQWLAEGIRERLKALTPGSDSRMSAPMMYASGLLPPVTGVEDEVHKWFVSQLGSSNPSPFLHVFMSSGGNQWTNREVSLDPKDPGRLMFWDEPEFRRSLVEKSQELYDMVNDGRIKANGAVPSDGVPDNATSFRWKSHPDYDAALADEMAGKTSLRLRDIKERTAVRGGYQEKFSLTDINTRDLSVADIHGLQFLNMSRGRSSLIPRNSEAWIPDRSLLDVAQFEGKERNVKVRDFNGNEKEIPTFDSSIDAMVRGFKIPYMDAMLMEKIRSTMGIEGATVMDMLYALKENWTNRGNVLEKPVDQQLWSVELMYKALIGLPLDQARFGDEGMVTVATTTRSLASVAWGSNQAVGILVGEVLLGAIDEVSSGRNGLKGLVTWIWNLIESAWSTATTSTNALPFGPIHTSEFQRGTSQALKTETEQRTRSDPTAWAVDHMGGNPISKGIDAVAKIKLKPSMLIGQTLRESKQRSSRAWVSRLFPNMVAYVNDTKDYGGNWKAKLRAHGLNTSVGWAMLRSGLLSREFTEGWSLLGGHVSRARWKAMDVHDAITEMGTNRPAAERAFMLYGNFENNWIRGSMFEDEAGAAIKPHNAAQVMLAAYRSFPMMAFAGRVMRDAHLYPIGNYIARLLFYTLGEIFYALGKLFFLNLIQPDRAKRQLQRWQESPKMMAMLSILRSPTFGMFGSVASDMAASATGKGVSSGFSPLGMEALSGMTRDVSEVFNAKEGKTWETAKSNLIFKYSPVLSEPMYMVPATMGYNLLKNLIYTEVNNASSISQYTPTGQVLETFGLKAPVKAQNRSGGLTKPYRQPQDKYVVKPVAKQPKTKTNLNNISNLRKELGKQLGIGNDLKTIDPGKYKLPPSQKAPPPDIWPAMP